MVTFNPTAAKDGPDDSSDPDRAAAAGLHLTAGVIAIDARALVTACNASAESLTGLTAAAVLHRSVEVLPAPLRRPLELALRTGQPSEATLVLVHGSSGANVELFVQTTPLLTEDGPPLGALTVLSELSPLRKLNVQLRHFDRLASIGTLSAGMAHEIKNALVAIRAFIDLLLQQGSESRLAETVSRELYRIDGLVTQMLRFSGPGRPQLVRLQLHQVIEQALELIRQPLADGRIEVIRSLSAQPEFVQGDPSQLMQAVLNLLLNAMEAMSDHGRLTVVTERLASHPTGGQGTAWLRLSIQDTGRGIEAGHMEKLFQPFFTTKPEGTGIGLAITRWIIEEHRGHITVESQAGRGATFTILLPIDDRSF